MRKSLKITNVRNIFTIEKPIVVFEVENHEALVRNPKQALIDLQNSGRALSISPNALDNGIEGVSQKVKAEFIEALLDTVGAEVTGEISRTKAGDKYTPNETHPIFTDKKHPKFNTIKLGDSLVAEKDSVWVEGFLSIFLTEKEKFRREASKEYAKAMMAMMGIDAPVVTTSNYGGKSDEEFLREQEETDLQTEAFKATQK